MDSMKEDGLPLPAPQPGWALFLDFDGTLTELAPSPDAVVVDPAMPQVLAGLLEGLGGAVAVVSGRSLAEVDRLLGVVLPGAGVHGLELRTHRDAEIRPPAEAEGIAVIASVLTPLVEADPRLILETKPGAVALHYRRAPEREKECRAAMKAAVAGTTGIHVIDGKMVLEAKPDHVNKGYAIENLMQVPPFAGRVPVFAGDDRTDEDGFGVVRALKGVTIKIGPGLSRAEYRVASVEAFIDWLKEVASVLSDTG
ncbi:HAD-superfamily hydrolase, subfamily IIB [Parvibaculum lavamentivorans DS-1]|uniref:Trehalose 6-phosphate phosphatase n=1 Tax=Parvibaculum lavamentivorans (strain DS-1 / DSM 13023 / NCIMB 13966) TaxID=402881 RepID=A7HPU6_PARL1|nr:trehalose-phosphatase [Parvibaculum lavamentivorans]ABS61929.1 HAD-superfamily hydrolase, subfamily IIB [Parvibaculum lavamentivorans DS-1]